MRGGRFSNLSSMRLGNRTGANRPIAAGYRMGVFRIARTGAPWRGPRDANDISQEDARGPGCSKSDGALWRLAE